MNTKDVIKVIIGLVIMIFVADFFSYLMWKGSGQVPDGNFYAGMITAKVLGPIR